MVLLLSLWSLSSEISWLKLFFSRASDRVTEWEGESECQAGQWVASMSHSEWVPEWLAAMEYQQYPPSYPPYQPYSSTYPAYSSQPNHFNLKVGEQAKLFWSVLPLVENEDCIRRCV